MLPRWKFRFSWRASLGVAALAIAACAGIAATCVLIAQQNAPAANVTNSAAHPIAQKSRVAGVQNFGQVNANLLRGAQPTNEGFEQLAKMGVAIVVDLRDDGQAEHAAVTKLGMQYVSIPSHCYSSLDSSVAQFLDLVRKNPDKKIFVHCHVGTDRTGMAIAAYRMTQQGWTAAEARREMEAFGFSFEHQMICPGLADYEANFPHDFATNTAFEKLRSTPQAPATPAAPAAAVQPR
jgi:tyrosine-protein phosphatase SIW14